MTYDSLDKYKTQINLAEFILYGNYGFVLSESSSFNSPKLKKLHPTETYWSENKKKNVPVKTEEYVIKKNEKGFYTYWSPNDDSLKGKTIIDFVQEHHKAKNGGFFNLGLVRKYLESYMKGGKYIQPDKSEFKILNTLKENDTLKLEVKNCTPYKDRTYLHKRGIKNSTIDNPMFENIIRNKVFDKNGVIHINTAYLMVNLSGIGAINVKNKTFDKSISGAIGDRGNSIVISKDLSHGNHIDKLIITESFDDALSHFQLNEDTLKNLNIRYISTAGSLCEGQIALIEEIITKQKPKEFIIGFDNDVSGNFFRAQLMGKLQVADVILSKDFIEESKAFAYTHIECKREKLTGIVDFIFANKNQEEGIQNVMELKQYIDIFNEKNKNIVYEGVPFNYTVKLADDNKAIAQLTFRNTKENWQLIGNLIAEVKYEKGLFFKQEIPIKKDFNEDLMQGLQNKNHSMNL